MQRRNQELFGGILFVSGILLILSTFVPELLSSQRVILSQNDLISILLGIIITYIGYKGTKRRW